MGCPCVASLLVLSFTSAAALPEAMPARAQTLPAAVLKSRHAVADSLDDSDDPPEIRAIWARIDALLKEDRQREVIPHLRKLLVWQDRHLGPVQARSLRSLSLLTATLLYAAIQPEEASKKAAELHKRLLRSRGVKSYDVAEALMLQARAEKNLGNFPAASTLARKAQERLQAFATILPLKLADSWELIGTIQQEEGRYWRALESQSRAKDLREQNGAPLRLLARSESNIGQILLRLGRPAESLRRLEQALARYESLAEETRANRSAVWSNIGAAEQAMGRLDKAIVALGRSLALRESLGPDTPDTAQIRLNQADLLAQTGWPAVALAETHRALAVLERQLGPHHVQAAMARYRLGDLARLRRDPTTALVEYGRALTIRHRLLSPDHPDLATTHLGIALSRLALGQIGAAEKDLERALVIRRLAYGHNHPYSLQVRFLLGLLHNQGGQRQRSYAELRAVAEEHSSFLQREVPLLPKAERDRVVGSLEPVRHAIYSLALQGHDAAATAFQLRLNQHGLLEGIERRQRDLLTADPAIAAAAKQLLSLQAALADQRLDSAARSRLNQRRAEQERQLYAAVPELARKVVSPAALAPALGDDGALVEYVRYRPTQLKNGRLSSTAEPHYLAFVIRGGAVSAVNLQAAEPIEAAVRRALRSTRVRDPGASTDWAGVRRLIVEPLLPVLGGRSRIYVSPDAELHRVAFAALGLEGWRLRLLTSGRDLLDAPSQGAGGHALVVAAPDYGEAGGSRTTSSEQIIWPPLPRSRDEAIRVSGLVGGNLKVGKEATVGLVMGSKSPHVLHLASHGAFLQDEEMEPETIESSDPLAEHPIDVTSALRRAVVVLAGANRGNDSSDDGYLSALEVSMMDLQQTRLVTLSACETNRGKIRTGEGVYGMRRALAVAGARTSLLSLWKVDDGATSELMGMFYTHLASGDEPHAALEAAQEQFRSHKDVNLRHPFWWAGFQIYGP